MEITGYEVIEGKYIDEQGHSHTCPVIVVFKETESFSAGHTVSQQGFIPHLDRQTPETLGITPEASSKVFFKPVTHAEGVWKHLGPDHRGLKANVTEGSGDGELFRTLELIRKGNMIQPI
ncbi:hypothetical protein KIH39_13740 [Telmatocola sphagniphila]|uniref:Uncharacterized protein n=1 Tax=Telmatocola sphagniphila TaxID=1123043 RepID=A0A8E6B2L8_9BACT|nr:hypothetical protein [Telmatocola sphagniphila]QVL29931.1 hypothetical protein KIH39_13740 [Telmatocola sphagniphila]